MDNTSLMKAILKVLTGWSISRRAGIKVGKSARGTAIGRRSTGIPIGPSFGVTDWTSIDDEEEYVKKLQSPLAVRIRSNSLVATAGHFQFQHTTTPPFCHTLLEFS